MKAGKKVTIVAAAAIAAVILASSPAQADKVRDAQWHVRDLNLAQAHQVSRGGGITIAVVDSGVFPHKDLSRNLEKGTDFLPGGDGAGQKDETGHGTSMAGLIAGHGRNGQGGVIGIAPEATIIPVRAISTKVAGTSLEQGIQWAAEAGTKIINVSGGTQQSRSLREAIAAAVKSDSVVVAASGNKSQTPRLGFPAASPEVLAVGAVDQEGKTADFSVTGPKVAICAPGVGIVSTARDDKYSTSRGTSEASAIVSGAAALVRAKFPELSAPEVIHRLTATATDNGPPGRDDQCGFGVLDIVKALTADVPPLDPSGSTGPTAPSGSSSPVNSSAPAGNGSSADAVSPSEPPGSDLPVIAGIGAAVVGIGVVLALVVRRRRSSPPESPTQEARPAE